MRYSNTRMVTTVFFLIIVCACIVILSAQTENFSSEYGLRADNEQCTTICPNNNKQPCRYECNQIVYQKCKNYSIAQNFCSTNINCKTNSFF